MAKKKKSSGKSNSDSLLDNNIIPFIGDIPLPSVNQNTEVNNSNLNTMQTVQYVATNEGYINTMQGTSMTEGTNITWGAPAQEVVHTYNFNVSFLKILYLKFRLLYDNNPASANHLDVNTPYSCSIFLNDIQAASISISNITPQVDQYLEFFKNTRVDNTVNIKIELHIFVAKGAAFDSGLYSYCDILTIK